MYMFDFVNTAQQPALHSCSIDKRDPDANDGKRCTVRALFGRYGMLSSPMCVDDTVSPLGRMADILLLVFLFLVMGMLLWRYLKKWSVAPVSAMVCNPFFCAVTSLALVCSHLRGWNKDSVPPFLFRRVASSLWFSPLCVHEALLCSRLYVMPWVWQ